jgi:hypothetical protein
MGCGVLFALLVIVVALALIFGLPAFLGIWQEAPIEPIEQPTPTEKKPSPPPDNNKAEQKKKKDDTPQTITIRVTGTPGVAFRGAYATGASDSPGVLEGVTPQDFEVPVRTDATEVAAHVANRNEGNEELTLQLLVGGEVVEEKSSTEGWVSV